APAASRSRTCRTVASTSVVRVAVMLCTATGWPAPMVIRPMRTALVCVRGWLLVGVMPSRGYQPAPMVLNQCCSALAAAAGGVVGERHEEAAAGAGGEQGGPWGPPEEKRCA